MIVLIINTLPWGHFSGFVQRGQISTNKYHFSTTTKCKRAINQKNPNDDAHIYSAKFISHCFTSNDPNFE